MFPKAVAFRALSRAGFRLAAAVIAIFTTFNLLVAPGALAQSQPSQQSQSNQTEPSKTQSPQAPAEAGGPQGDIGPIALPKKKEEPPPPPPTGPKKIEGMPEYSITKNVPLVTVDVNVLTKDGQFIPGLKKDNFRVFEDGVPQQISNFSQQEAPITAVLLVEFAANSYYFMYDALNASYTFASTLRPDDWIAVVSFDMKDYILTDFTQDKRAVYGALGQLRIPGFSETNVFDALYDTLDRIDGLEGRKYIILISTGRDTFSKITLDKMLKKIQATSNVTIFTVSTGEALRLYAESHGGMGPLTDLDFLQADNQMNTFAKMTGGRWYKPRFEGELPEIFRDIGATIRNEYVLGYHPSNAKMDGSYRKLKVEVVGPNGQPLQVKNQKGKDIKYTIIARDGYRAKHEVD